MKVPCKVVERDGTARQTVFGRPRRRDHTMWCAVVALALLYAATRSAAALPEGGIGITAAPDSVVPTDATRGCPDEWKDGSGGHFYAFSADDCRPWVDRDIDLLIDESFAAHPGTLNQVTFSEACRLTSPREPAFIPILSVGRPRSHSTFQPTASMSRCTSTTRPAGSSGCWLRSRCRRDRVL